MTMAYFRHKSFYSSFLSIIFAPTRKIKEITITAQQQKKMNEL